VAGIHLGDPLASCTHTASRGEWPWILRQGLTAIGTQGEAKSPKTLAEIVPPVPRLGVSKA
jgi:hypothetical protein